MVSHPSDKNKDVARMEQPDFPQGLKPTFIVDLHLARLKSCPFKTQSTTLLSGYSTMPVAFAAFRRGITSRATRSSTMVLTATQSEFAELGDGGRVERGQHGEHRVKIAALHVEHEAHLRLRVDCAAQHEGDLVDLLALPRVGDGFFAGDEMRLALHDSVDDLEAVGLERAAGLSDFNDGVGEQWAA